MIGQGEHPSPHFSPLPSKKALTLPPKHTKSVKDLAYQEMIKSSGNHNNL